MKCRVYVKIEGENGTACAKAIEIKGKTFEQIVAKIHFCELAYGLQYKSVLFEVIDDAKSENSESS